MQREADADMAYNVELIQPNFHDGLDPIHQHLSKKKLAIVWVTYTSHYDM